MLGAPQMRCLWEAGAVKPSARGRLERAVPEKSDKRSVFLVHAGKMVWSNLERQA